MALLDHILGKHGVATQRGPLPVQVVSTHQGEGNETLFSDAAGAGSRSEPTAMNSASEPRLDDPSRPPSEQMAHVHRMTKVLASARAQSARIVGVTGTKSGVGVSIVSREIAGAFAGFGKKTLLVDLSRAIMAEATGDVDAVSTFPFPESASEACPQLFVSKFEAPMLRSMPASQLRSALSSYVQSGFVVIVDLPPVLSADGAISPSIAALAELCDQVLLVCLSGKIQEKELSACVEAFSVVGIKPAGLILNDWQMPVSKLITD